MEGRPVRASLGMHTGAFIERTYPKPFWQPAISIAVY